MVSLSSHVLYLQLGMALFRRSSQHKTYPIFYMQMSGSRWVMGGTSGFGLTLGLALQPLSNSYSPDCITSPCSNNPALQIYVIWQIHLSTYPGEDPSGLVKTAWGRAWSQRCSVVSFSQMVQTARYGNFTALACTKLNQVALFLIVYR